MVKHSTAPIQLSLKLNPGQVPWRGKGNVFSYFRYYEKVRGAGKKMQVRAKQISRPNRFPSLTAFLRKNRGQINIFAEVGASNLIGAPMAFDARQALGKKSKVFAVDVVKMPNEYFRGKQIEPLLHAISRKPLPFKCDAIRFTNTSMYMSEGDMKRSVINIWKSLNEGGVLLSSNSGKVFILRKTKDGFEEVRGWKSEPTIMAPDLMILSLRHLDRLASNKLPQNKK